MLRNRWIANIAAAIFCSQFVLLDVILGSPYDLVHPLNFTAGGIQSVALWAGVSQGAVRLVPRLLIAFASSWALTSQWFFFRYYHTWFDAQMAAATTHMWADIRPTLAAMIPGMAMIVCIGTILEFIGLSLFVKIWRASPRLSTARRSAIALLPAALVINPLLNQRMPDMRIIDALTALRSRPPSSSSKVQVIPPSASVRTTVPNVLFILSESVRDADYCSDPATVCQTSPAVHQLLPRRVPLRQLRSIDSYTAISIASMITGRAQLGPRGDLLAWPNLFEFLRGVRVDDKPLTTAYWSSHSVSIFDEKEIQSAVSSFMSLESLVGRHVDDEDPFVLQGIDRDLLGYFLNELPKLAPPAFIFLHFSGTHAPYFFNERDAPFQPWSRDVMWSGLPSLHNAYRNAIFEQDRSIARAIQAFLDVQRAAPYVIIFTSDHGEAFGEHSAIHHGQNLYEEQIHVPGWVAWGNGALSEEQTVHLREMSDAPLTHLDVLPTILDLYGVLDAPVMALYHSRWKGRSWLRPPGSAIPIPLTNCTALFPCPINTWGMLQGDMQLVAQAWDPDWKCINLRTGQPYDRSEPPACQVLRRASKEEFQFLPNHAVNP